MKDADFEFQKDFIRDSKKDTIGLSVGFYALKNTVKYSYLIINCLIIAAIIGFIYYNYHRNAVIAEMNSQANADIAHAWYEAGQKPYESVWTGLKEGELLQFTGEMSNGFLFEMTLKVDDDGNATGAYVYKNLESINKDLPAYTQVEENDFEDEEDDAFLNSGKEVESSNYVCAALSLEGKIKGSFAPGKKISINLSEYNSSHKKIGSFKGEGTFDLKNEMAMLIIGGMFKNHEGQKNSFTMRLSNYIHIESMSKIIDNLLQNKTIKRVLYLNDKENPYAIVVTKNKEIRMLKYSGPMTNYEKALQDATPFYGIYNRDNVLICEDCILLRNTSEWITYSDGEYYVSAEKIDIIDLRDYANPKNTSIDGVIWNDELWKTCNRFYVVESDDNPINIIGYNKYGEAQSEITLPIFHVRIPEPGIIEGDVWEEESEDNPYGNLVTKRYDFDGNEL